MTGARIAIDIGGSFTDVAVGTADGYVTAKTLTTPAEPVTGVLDGIALALGRGASISIVIGSARYRINRVRHLS